MKLSLKLYSEQNNKRPTNKLLYVKQNDKINNRFSDVFKHLKLDRLCKVGRK